ncbi:MAG: hypothetical protein F6K54_05550 [Okeania sp. SIO3B5]|uniref:hypothetical protein n=1 Tax=Okeania sp. SIO3B5 TaxID=2607811 RepID=UPI0014001372|nr:hypothetical protein [Okeania sp. SIO3B5]NEO52584.1 hypothetical protein [Okeania sp. SIO3B5]
MNIDNLFEVIRLFNLKVKYNILCFVEIIERYTNYVRSIINNFSKKTVESSVSIEMFAKYGKPYAMDEIYYNSLFRKLKKIKIFYSREIKIFYKCKCYSLEDYPHSISITFEIKSSILTKIIQMIKGNHNISNNRFTIIFSTHYIKFNADNDIEQIIGVANIEFTNIINRNYK